MFVQDLYFYNLIRAFPPEADVFVINFFPPAADPGWV